MDVFDGPGNSRQVVVALKVAQCRASVCHGVHGGQATWRFAGSEVSRLRTAIKPPEYLSQALCGANAALATVADWPAGRNQPSAILNVVERSDPIVQADCQVGCLEIVDGRPGEVL